MTVHFSFNNSLIVKIFTFFFAEPLSRQNHLLGPDSSRLNLVPMVSLNIYLFRYFYEETGETFWSIHDTKIRLLIGMATLCNIVSGNTLQYLGSPDTNNIVWGWWTYWRDKLWEQTPLLSHSAHLQQELGWSPAAHAAEFCIECFRLLMYWSLRERTVGYLCFILADSHTRHVIPNFDLSLGPYRNTGLIVVRKSFCMWSEWWQQRVKFDS